MPMEIQVRTDAPGEIAADLLVIGVWHSGANGGNAAKGAGLPPYLKTIDAALGGALTKLATREDFTGKRDQTLSLSTLGRIGAEKLVVMGLGEKKNAGAPEIRTFAAKAARTANGEKARAKRRRGGEPLA
jgi:leucyl aminopeptidase